MSDSAHQTLTNKKRDNRRKAREFQHSWWGKTLAGVFLGIPLCFALSNSLFYIDLTSKQASITMQLTMWCTVISWLCVLSGVYFFRSVKLAWLWLGAACILACAVLWWVKQ